MADIKDLDTAKQLVKQFYPNAADPALEILLEDSKSINKGYRPFFVAAYFMFTEYRKIVKAEDVTFSYNTLFTIQGLLNMQKAKDCNDLSIDSCWSVDSLASQLEGDSFTVPSAFVL